MRCGVARRRGWTALWTGSFGLHPPALLSRPLAGVAAIVVHPTSPGRPAPRLRVRPFPANIDPAGTTASADFSTASDALSSATVPHHPANRMDGVSGTPAEISLGKASNLPRTPTASTRRPLDDNGLCRNRPARPDRLASYAQPTTAPAAADHVFLGSRFRLRLPSHPASRRRSCPWLVVGVISSTGDSHPRAAGHARRTGRDGHCWPPPARIPACASTHWAPPLGFGVESLAGPGMKDAGSG